MKSEGAWLAHLAAEGRLETSHLQIRYQFGDNSLTHYVDASYGIRFFADMGDRHGSAAVLTGPLHLHSQDQQTAIAARFRGNDKADDHRGDGAMKSGIAENAFATAACAELLSARRERFHARSCRKSKDFSKFLKKLGAGSISPPDCEPSAASFLWGLP